MRCWIRAATIAGVLLVFLATAAAQVRLSTISGRVLTSDGKPCPDAAVLAIPEPSLQTPSGRIGALLTKTDTEGRY